MSKPHKFTIRDVARQAGVSISSVSRALSEHPHVSAELSQRVKAVAQSMGYQPDFRGHSLRSGSTHSVGFLVGTLSNPIIADISVNISNVLAGRGYATLLVCSQNQPEQDVAYLHFLLRRQVNGLIVSSAADGPDQTRPILHSMGLPTVLLDREWVGAPHVSAVLSDHQSGVQAAVAHLANQGHQRIAIIGGPLFFYPAHARLQGYYTGLEAAQLPVDTSLVRAIGMGRVVGYQEMLNLLRLAQPPTALIAGGNLILAGVLQALQEHQVQVGRDLALVGCDDTELTRLYRPSISVIARDLALLGKTAAQLLLEIIEHGSGKPITLPTQLVVRESSLCVPRAG